ncbi:hypothetical protein E8K88_02540 [Lampropedia aestuarii]|uniref:Uncharacterized protein n=1 Tax=Lampropedia aestuarii TaxID=2562762 RepID=A0A4V3YXQ8_9BURK|nr:hypothetical protein [Lampropedia aestuarii]THJ36162.1 hypothetical protein E8K88_02540 [Lampropedia aestuarii]
MAKATGKLFRSFPTQSVTHAAMKGMHDYLLAIGLSSFAHANRYDVDGDVSQAPPSSSNPPWASKWMFYSFTDSLQSESPIFVGFRIEKTFQISAPATTFYTIGWAVCDRISDAGEPSGRALSTIASTSSTGLSHSTIYEDHAGDYLRYTGDSLTVSIGASFIRQTSAAGQVFYKSCSFFHVERQRKNDGALSDGFAIVADLNAPGVAGTDVTVFATNSSDYSTSPTWAYRSGGTAKKTSGLVPIVAPIYYPVSGTGEGAVFRRIFTVQLGHSDIYSDVVLDFSGVDKLYLSYWNARAYPASPDFGYLLENE